MPLTISTLAQLIFSQTASDQPEALFQTYMQTCRDVFGLKLLTVFRWNPGSDEVLRIFSSDNELYPTGRWKPMGPTEWGAKVLKNAETVLCNTEQDLKWAYPDYELLIKLDCIASMSAPVVSAGKVIGSSTICDSAGAYTAEQLNDFALLVQCLSPAILAETSR